MFFINICIYSLYLKNNKHILFFSIFISVVPVQQCLLLELSQQDHTRDLSINRNKSATVLHFQKKADALAPIRPQRGSLPSGELMNYS